MEDLFQNFKSEDNQKFTEALETFVNNYESVKKFEFLDKNNFRSEIWEAILSHLKNKDEQTIHEKCLHTLRILSRDSTNINTILSKENLNVIIEYAGLSVKQDKYVDSTVSNEAQKLLCNLLYNSSEIKNNIKETNCLQCVIDRISKYNESTMYDTKLFDLRLVFLATVLNKATTNYVRNELHGDIHLIKLLEDICKNFSDNIEIKDDDAALICEILRTLYNLLVEKDSAFEELEICDKLVFILRKILTNSNEKHKQLFESLVISLLTVIPPESCPKLIIPLPNKTENIVTYQDMDMTVVNILITSLSNKLNNQTNSLQLLPLVLNALVNLCVSVKLIRKYVRLQVLPPLKDVTKRPEEGSELRNKLCKVLTSPVTGVKNAVEEFIFVLCKGNVGRIIKYVGYGNAAGMFASRGLLGRAQSNVDYSSDSEDSETEEYEKYKNLINPVTGCYEKPKPNPFEGMTEEQKEYEALKLVNLVDQLQRTGVIQPCRVGDDGKPKPIEHVLELQHLRREQVRKQNQGDSDSD